LTNWCKCIAELTHMSLFLLSFLLIYGGFHLYFFLKAKAAFTLPGWASFLLAAFFLIMIAAPIFVRISERIGYDRLATFLAYSGYTWMGIIFLFVSASLAVDGCRLLVWILRLLLHKKLLLQISLLHPSSLLSDHFSSGSF